VFVKNGEKDDSSNRSAMLGSEESRISYAPPVAFKSPSTLTDTPIIGDIQPLFSKV
jgi:hypothetical protein